MEKRDSRESIFLHPSIIDSSTYGSKKNTFAKILLAYAASVLEILPKLTKPNDISEGL